MATSSAPRSGSIPPPDDSPAHVLVIDDDRMSQMLLVRNLTQAGYVVQSASGGVEGLAKMRAHPFDLVILDFVMPEMDGYEVLGEITRDAQLRPVPVVVVSGVGDVSNAATLVEAGAADYLTKPIDSGLLRARASRCVDAKRMREREQRLHAEIEAGYAKLRELERLKDSLTHMIIHDLRTPLTSLLSSLKTVTQLGDELTADKRVRLLDNAAKGGDALVELINDLLEVNKLENGGAVLDRKTDDLEGALRQAVDQVTALAERAGVSVQLASAPLSPLSFDTARIRRVVVNLLGNAVKASPRGSTVTVRSADDAGSVRIDVEDTGTGIAPEHLTHLFEKFYRVEAGAGGTGSRSSTGLGLTFCKMIVEAHGGTIGVSSREGAGTTFSVTLPRT